MSTRTLIELNHDHSDKLNSPEFIAALARYLRNPGPDAADELSFFGAYVFGSAHSDDRNTRGFRNPYALTWYKVVAKESQ